MPLKFVRTQVKRDVPSHLVPDQGHPDGRPGLNIFIKRVPFYGVHS